MKPIPRDSNGSLMHGLVSDNMLVVLPGVAATGDGATLYIPEMKSIMMWAVNGTSAFTVANLGSATFTMRKDDTTYTGLVTDQVYLIDNAAATDEGGGLVGIPITGHPYTGGDSVTLAGSVAYNETYVLNAATTTNKIVIEATYAAEVFAGNETSTRTRTVFNDTLTVNGMLSVPLAFDTPRTLTFHGVGGAVDIAVAIQR